MSFQYNDVTFYDNRPVDFIVGPHTSVWRYSFPESRLLRSRTLHLSWWKRLWLLIVSEYNYGMGSSSTNF